MDDADPTVDLAGLEDDEDEQSNGAAEDDASRSPKPEGPLDALIGRHIYKLRKPIQPNREVFVETIKPKSPGELWNKARLGRIERGKQRVTITELDDICDALGVPLATFLQDAGVITIHPSTLGWLGADTTISITIRKAMIEQYEMAQRDYAAKQRAGN